jgi:hypothetical protein
MSAFAMCQYGGVRIVECGNERERRLRDRSEVADGSGM